MTTKTFVTVGAGQTAAVAARTLRRRGFDGRIVLIGDEPYAPYQRPPLSKEFLSGAENFESLLLLPQAWLARQRRRDHHRDRGDPRRSRQSHRRTRRRGTHRRRRGAVRHRRAARGPCPCRVRGPDLVHYLRTVDDAQRLQRTLAPGRRLVLIGAGFIGLEIAATASILGVDVAVLEAADVPLAGVLGPTTR